LQVTLMGRTVDDVTESSSIDLADRLIGVTGRVRRTLRRADEQSSILRSPNGERHNLTLSQEAVIGHLARGGAMTTADLARLEGVRPQSMGLTVTGLEDDGLVAKSSDPQDARRSLVDLTDAGRESRDRARDRRAGILAARFDSRLSPDELRLLDLALTLIDSVLEPTAAKSTVVKAAREDLRG
jgi:DNA-binding MarR family transcriptional regulator